MTGVRCGALALALTTIMGCAHHAPALREAARLQDPSSLEVFAGALHDPDPAIRREALFGIEQLGLAWEPLDEATRARAEALLLDPRLAAASGSVDDEALLSALGAVAGDKGVGTLAERARLESAAAARALGNWLHRNKKTGWPAGALPAIEGDRETRRALAYVLMRAADRRSAGELLRGLHDEDAEVRALSARGLGAMKGFGGQLGEMVESDLLKSDLAQSDGQALGGDSVHRRGEMRARIEAVRALGQAANADDAASQAFSAALRGHALHLVTSREEVAQVLWAGLESAAPAAVLGDAAAPVLALAAEARARGDGAGRGYDLARLECEAAAAVDRRSSHIDKLLSCGGELLDESARERRIARALGELYFDGWLERTSSLAHAVDAATRAFAVESLGKIGVKSNDRVKEIASQIKALVRGALEDKDGPVVANAAEAAAKLADRDAGGALVSALSRFSADTDVEIAQSLMDAIAELKVTSATPVLRKFRVANNAAARLAAKKALKALGADPGPDIYPKPTTNLSAEPPVESRLRVVTDKGTIVIDLARAAAPRTTRALVNLAKKKFYDGLTFHRVVPGFVAQGGDPRGDGWGGPGFLLPCEVSPLHYLRGTVGMALSGKDTGGSQFFITYSMTPHLDGRYPIVGQVSEGMDVADALLPGDRILSITAEQ